MNLKTTSKKIVEEAKYGVYVWEMPDGRWVGDEDGNFLSIASMKGDVKRVQQLRDAAKSVGVTTGKPLFLSGHRKIDDEEYEKQRQRMSWGLVPDENDIPALMERGN